MNNALTQVHLSHRSKVCASCDFAANFEHDISSASVGHLKIITFEVPRHPSKESSAGLFIDEYFVPVPLVSLVLSSRTV